MVSKIFTVNFTVFTAVMMYFFIVLGNLNSRLRKQDIGLEIALAWLLLHLSRMVVYAYWESGTPKTFLYIRENT